MVRDEGEHERVDVDRSRGPGTGKKAKKSPAARGARDHRRRVHRRPRAASAAAGHRSDVPEEAVEAPAGIDEGEVRGPEQLAQVEPDDAAGEKDPLDRRQREVRAFRPELRALDPGRPQPRGRADQNQGAQGATSRRPAIRPRFHQKTTSSAAGSVATTVFVNRPSTNSPDAWR